MIQDIAYASKSKPYCAGSADFADFADPGQKPARSKGIVGGKNSLTPCGLLPFSFSSSQ
jgi:hypothetical protein